MQGYNVKLYSSWKIEDKKIYKKLKINHLLIILHLYQRKNLIEFIGENDIFVMPSINETFGLVYAEAMSQGLPVIYTKGQGFDKQFNDGLWDILLYLILQSKLLKGFMIF